ncbi:hypothetical protein T484DRAFT_1766516 [Baffinella frigidus]|nr:hypothetical protein T484DRAFT_1766516 [Cryptophyta sp. CCMP2293]
MRDKEPHNLAGFGAAGGRTGKEGGGDPNEASVVLFEEVDVLADEDRGFLAVLASLAEQSQVPVLLTCTHVPPQLRSLRLREFRFSAPEPREPSASASTNSPHRNPARSITS